MRIRLSLSLLLAIGLCSGACSPNAESAAQLLPQGPLRYEIEYATYFGGPRGEEAREVIVYPDGSVLVGMQTTSAGLPTSPNAFQKAYAGGDPDAGHPGIHGGDLYFLHLSADGSRLLAGSYFGGSRQERSPYGMELDAEGNVVFATLTRSPDWPTTEGALQRRYGGDPGDMGVAALSPDLSQQLMGTYVGGRGGDTPRGGIDLDQHGNVYVIGSTDSPDLPIPAAKIAGHRAHGSGLLAVLRPDGSLIRGARIGGKGETVIVGIRVGPDGTQYLGGYTDSPDFPVTAGAAQPKLAGKTDLFFSALSPAGDLLYSTFHGGSGAEYSEHRIWLEEDGSVLMTGYTESDDFPTTPGAFQTALHGKAEASLSKLNAGGESLAFATLMGGAKIELMLMPQVDASGRVTLVGHSQSHDFPITRGALQERHAGGKADGVLVVTSPDGKELVYSSFLGGSDDELVRSFAFGADGALFLIGRTASKDFPVTERALQRHHGGANDAFIVKLRRVRDSKASD